MLKTNCVLGVVCVVGPDLVFRAKFCKDAQETHADRAKYYSAKMWDKSRIKNARNYCILYNSACVYNCQNVF